MNSVEPLVPKGYKLIAVRQERFGTNEIYFHAELKRFVIYMNSKMSPPFTLDELKVIKENIDDVISMRGSYNYIEDY